MIIRFRQTASNIKQTYLVTGESFSFQGEAGSVSALQSIVMRNSQTALTGVYQFTKWYNYLPLLQLFGFDRQSRKFSVLQDEKELAEIWFSRHGFLKSCYRIRLKSGRCLTCYPLGKGSFDYVSVYENDQQIALIETYLSVTDYKYGHVLYLLPEHDDLAEILSFFILYYASYAFAQRLNMSKSSTTSYYLWSYSRYKRKYNPNWREEHFPEENFFGKAHLI